MFPDTKRSVANRPLETATFTTARTCRRQLPAPKSYATSASARPWLETNNRFLLNFDRTRIYKRKILVGFSQT